ncbi:MAG: class I SAM-dependent methyltransferase, partial [bacterium]|nr:class I SAM-dependent methyltransferase [bacterium]
GCLFSNELLDAFPVHRVAMDDRLQEIYVDLDGDRFTEKKQPIGCKGLTDYAEEFDLQLRRGYQTEINLRMKSWLAEICRKLSHGFLLTVDYGYSAQEYYTETRSSGTLLCYHNHQLHENPYIHVGEQDMTAHVNFSALKKWGEEQGLKTLGYAPQGAFLTAAGMDEAITELYAEAPDYLSEILKIKGLILPQGMGETHNFMIQYRGEGMPQLRGFSLRNRLASL